MYPQHLPLSQSVFFFPTFDHVYEPEFLETPVTPLNSPLSTPVLDGQIETPTIGQ